MCQPPDQSNRRSPRRAPVQSAFSLFALFRACRAVAGRKRVFSGQFNPSRCRASNSVEGPLMTADATASSRKTKGARHHARALRKPPLTHTTRYSARGPRLGSLRLPDRSERKRCKYEPRETNKTKMQGPIMKLCPFYLLFGAYSGEFNPLISAGRTAQLTRCAALRGITASICRPVPSCRCLH